MPITQARMLKLIQSGQDYQQALESTVDLIATQRRRVQAGEISPQTALDFLSQFIKPDLLLNSPVESQVNLITEYRHFKLYFNKNISAQRRKERQRRREGVPVKGDTKSNILSHSIPPDLPDIPLEWESPPAPAPTARRDSPSNGNLDSSQPDSPPDKEGLF